MPKNEDGEFELILGNRQLISVFLIVIILLLIGVFPTWPHSANWGYFPSGGLGLVLIVVVVLMLVGRI